MESNSTLLYWILPSTIRAHSFCIFLLLQSQIGLFSFAYFSGLEILAFPCNQFGSQEPGSNEEIQEFVCTRFKAEYPVFDKVRRYTGDLIYQLS